MRYNLNSEQQEESVVLSKAIISLKEKWKLTNKDVADIIGVDASYMTRLQNGKTYIVPASKTGELSLMLIRVFRSLGAFLGDRMTIQKKWLVAGNAALNTSPIEAMKTVEGLSRVVIYLDALRGADS